MQRFIKGMIAIPLFAAALMLARTLPLEPTVRRLSDSRVPSTSPSTSNSSRELISPLMCIEAPMVAAWRTGAGGGACGRGLGAGSAASGAGLSIASG